MNFCLHIECVTVSLLTMRIQILELFLVYPSFFVLILHVSRILRFLGNYSLFVRASPLLHQVLYNASKQVMYDFVI